MVLNKMYLVLMKFFFYSLSFFSFLGMMASDDFPTSETIEIYETMMLHPESVKDKAKIKDAANSLRNYYIRHGKNDKLNWLNIQLMKIFDQDSRRQQMFYLLQSIETISLQISTASSVDDCREKIMFIVNQLWEFRWFERDLTRALSYVALGRCYYLLGDYQMAIKVSDMDRNLFEDIDKKFKESDQSEASPRASLLLLQGICYQKLSELEKEKNNKLKHLALALEFYYSFLKDYPQSESAVDVLSRYENCRAEFEALCHQPIFSLAEMQLKTGKKSHGIPPNIQLMIKSGNYQNAIQALERELKRIQNPPLSYWQGLAECAAYLGRDRDCKRYLENILEYFTGREENPEIIFNCASIFRAQKHPHAQDFYQLFYNNFKDNSKTGLACWALADIRLTNLRPLLKNNALNQNELNRQARDILKLYDIAAGKISDSSKQFYLYIGHGELNFILKNYPGAVADFRLALETKPGDVALIKNLIKALYFAAVQKSPADQAFLNEAESIIRKNKLDLPTTPDTLRLLAKIKEAENHKKEAAELLMKLIDSGNIADAELLNDLAKTSALFYESGDQSSALTILQKMSRYKTNDIVKAQFKIGIDLLRRNQISEACSLFETMLKNEKFVSINELQYLVEKLYNQTGGNAKRALHIAFRAGRLLENQKNRIRDKTLLGNIRLKTAMAAMRLENYPTALTMCDLVLADSIASLYFQAKSIKAETYFAMNDYQQAQFELTDIALAAARANQTGLYLSSKLRSAQIMASAKHFNEAILILDNLLIPLKSNEKIKPDSLPEIYKNILQEAIRYAEKTESANLMEYRSLFTRLFPTANDKENGKLKE